MGRARRPTMLWGPVALGLVAAGFMAWALWPSDPGPEGVTRTSEGEVTVIATLLEGHADPVRFKLVLDTHTVDLNGFDPYEQVRLEADSGVLGPASVLQTTDNTGHHVEMQLSFGGSHEGRLVLVVTGLDEEHRLVFG